MKVQTEAMTKLVFPKGTQTEIQNLDGKRRQKDKERNFENNRKH